MKNIRQESIYFLLFLCLVFYFFYYWKIVNIEKFKSKRKNKNKKNNKKTKETFLPDWISNPFSSNKKNKSNDDPNDLKIITDLKSTSAEDVLTKFNVLKNKLYEILK
jgi:hypothetical protein